MSGKANNVPPAAMTTLRIDAGRSDKLRPGDILGALTGEAGLKADAIGKIDVFATRSYVAVARGQAATGAGAAARGEDQGKEVPGQPAVEHWRKRPHPPFGTFSRTREKGANAA